MIRFVLSKAFSEVAYSSQGARDFRDKSRRVYADEIFKNVAVALKKCNENFDLSYEITDSGRVGVTLSEGHEKEPMRFSCEVEWSDLLLASGREAAVELVFPQRRTVLYYGNSWSPDNNWQFYDCLRNQIDVEKIAGTLQAEYHRYLYNSKAKSVMGKRLG